MADKGMYKPVEYQNAGRPGLALIVIPGEIKSNNASFVQKFGPNNIADYAELGWARPISRYSSVPIWGRFSTNSPGLHHGRPPGGAQNPAEGKFKTTKWVVKFDVLKAEPVAQAQSGFDGRAVGSLIGILGGSRGSSAAGVAVGSVQPANPPASGLSACAISSSTLTPPSRWLPATWRKRWNWAPRAPRFSVFQRRLGRPSPSTPWSSAWSRRTSGKSIPNTRVTPALGGMMADIPQKLGKYGSPSRTGSGAMGSFTKAGIP